MLTKKLSAYFDDQVRARGAEYVAEGRIRGVRVKKKLIEAIAQGSHLYRIAVRRLNSRGTWRLEVDCSCPFAAQNGGVCKHVWATLLEAEPRVEQVWGPTPKRVTIVGESYDWDDEGGGEVDENEDELYSSGPVSGTVLPKSARSGSNSEQVDAAIALAARMGITLRLSENAIQLLSEPGVDGTARPAPSKKQKSSGWKRMLEETRKYAWAPQDAGGSSATLPIGTPVWYVIDQESSVSHDGIVVDLMRGAASAAEPAGLPQKLVKLALAPEDVARIEGAEDRAICALLVGAASPGRQYAGYYAPSRSSQRSAQWHLDAQLAALALGKMAGTNRLLWRRNAEHAPEPASWSPDTPWGLALELVPQNSDPGASALLRPVLRRGNEEGESIGLSEFDMVIDGQPGAAMHGGRLSPLRVPGGPAGGMLRWAREVSQRRPTLVDRGDVQPLLRALAEKYVNLPVNWPDNWGPARVAGVVPRNRLVLTTQKTLPYERGHGNLAARIQFVYEGTAVDASKGGLVPVKRADGTDVLVQRDTEAERRAPERLVELGGKRDAYYGQLSVVLKRLPTVVSALLGEGWEVVKDAAVFRKPGEVNVRVTSGIDWFDLEGAAEFGETSATIGDVLAALQKGERFVSLGDGSLGLLPDEWLSKYGRWLGLGRTEGGRVRFSRAQLSLVDALMDAMPEASCDKQVTAAREKLRAFEGISERREPEGFRGQLRSYQRQGLGWLQFLAEFGLGGCLADDMGLGKTVQLLAHLADRRSGGEKGAWLVVAPKSLVLNWAKEAARFTPGLSVVDYTGTGRAALRDGLGRADLVLTTYATMRMDIEHLRGLEFRCVVLDEAQTIKNASSQAAKAARLLRASRRLALTGTPVENRLEDLWSIFEFLNPGMLGAVGAFRDAINVGQDSGGLDTLRRALRPFLLRRTKASVAPELPARSEQTVRCELEGKQKTLYQGLRTHYQQQLMGRVDREGMNKSRMHVLEALLRLRQAACHPALIEPKSTRKPSTTASDSAKVATLVEMLEELASEGHKALVFSQFTSLLALVKVELDRAKIGYEELDGDTSSKQRAERVDRFQSAAVKDGGSGVFLISLKAGGVGLNLTAAGYVFLLDPWWNPAVEAQAIDRAHRIGQDKSVIAYRLIATDTVEERILELQERKRELASAIISENAGPLSSMTREDLEWLLS